jgi:hypothetical protein
MRFLVSVPTRVHISLTLPVHGNVEFDITADEAKEWVKILNTAVIAAENANDGGFVNVSESP